MTEQSKTPTVGEEFEAVRDVVFGYTGCDDACAERTASAVLSALEAIGAFDAAPFSTPPVEGEVARLREALEAVSAQGPRQISDSGAAMQMLRIAREALATRTDPPQDLPRIYIRWSDNRENIRLWSREPFEHGEALEVVDAPVFFAYCPTCESNGPEADNAAEAANLWNTRHPIDASARDGALEEAARVADRVVVECKADVRTYREEDQREALAHGGAIEGHRIANLIRALKSTNPPAEPRVSETPISEHEIADVSGGRTRPADYCGIVQVEDDG